MASHSWPVPPGFQRVALDIGGVNEELMELLKSRPELLRTLTPRKFEELVAELLQRLGYTKLN